MSKINCLNGVTSILETVHVGDKFKMFVIDLIIIVISLNTHSLSSLEIVKCIDINMNQIDCITKFSDEVPNVQRKSPFNWWTIPKFGSKEDPGETQCPGHSKSGHIK